MSIPVPDDILAIETLAKRRTTLALAKQQLEADLEAIDARLVAMLAINAHAHPFATPTTEACVAAPEPRATQRQGYRGCLKQFLPQAASRTIELRAAVAVALGQWGVPLSLRDIQATLRRDGLCSREPPSTHRLSNILSRFPEFTHTERGWVLSARLHAPTGGDERAA